MTRLTRLATPVTVETCRAERGGAAPPRSR